MREMKEEIKNLFTRERILRLAAFSIDILVLALILSLCTLTLGKPNFAAARRRWMPSSKSQTSRPARPRLRWRWLRSAVHTTCPWPYGWGTRY